MEGNAKSGLIDQVQKKLSSLLWTVITLSFLIGGLIIFSAWLVGYFASFFLPGRIEPSTLRHAFNLQQDAKVAFQTADVIVKPRLASSVIVYMPLTSYTQMPFPNRAPEIGKLALNYCSAQEGVSFYAYLEFRDTWSNEKITGASCVFNGGMLGRKKFDR